MKTQSLTDFKKVLERHGLTVYSTSYKQATLLGGLENVETIVGLTSNGSSKIQLTLTSTGRMKLLVIHHAGSEQEAQEAADRLESLGLDVEVDGERVVASHRNPTLTTVARVVAELVKHWDEKL